MSTFSSTFAAAVISPTEAIAVNDDLYLNRALGIAVRKPSEWVFETLRKFQEIKSSQVLSDDIDPDLESEIRNSEDPLVIFGHDCGDDDRFAPSGALYAEHIELFEHETFDDLISNGENIYREVLPDFRITSAKPGISISGFESVRLESIFTYKTDKTSPTLVRNVSVFTRRHPFIYTLRLFDSPSNSMNAMKQFDGVIDSIHYS